jgi:hypothetical protein
MHMDRPRTPRTGDSLCLSASLPLWLSAEVLALPPPPPPRGHAVRRWGFPRTSSARVCSDQPRLRTAAVIALTVPLLYTPPPPPPPPRGAAAPPRLTIAPPPPPRPRRGLPSSASSNAGSAPRAVKCLTCAGSPVHTCDSQSRPHTPPPE